jgi:hypothetical protein
MKNTTISILKYLKGRKTTIVAVIALTFSFANSKGLIDTNTSVYLNSILTLVAFGANYATNKLVK